MLLSRGLATVLLICSNVFIPIALLIFAQGFFPYKPFIPGKAQYDNADRSNAPFDKVIFMVVDALRSDFVFGPDSGFLFTQSLIRTGAAQPFTAHATSPTITMPRVKAMTTGSIPSFLDVILNFAESDTTSTLANQDTWLAQLRAKPQGNIVMYGDDTWLKLFPDTFLRADGTSSFFVSDFTEVDNNVTRHVPRELHESDWNAMIMHYLGLDHIGHKSGPRSPHMIPKQKEMDTIVKQIYEAMESESHLLSSVLVLCGDHGMNDAGNHGGSAPGETSPALVFISPKFKDVYPGLESPSPPPSDDFQYYKTVEQSDIVPTLAGLLGFPVPLNNLGVAIDEVLEYWYDDSSVIQLMEENSQQIMNIVRRTMTDIQFEEPPNPKTCLDPASDGEALHCAWEEVRVVLNRSSGPKEDKMAPLAKFMQIAQQRMSSAASNYNILKLKAGISMAAISVVLALVSVTILVKCTAATAMWSIAILFAYGGIMFASSFVEEEQNFWYWMASGWLAWICMKLSSFRGNGNSTQTASVAALLFVFRLLRRWNQTGQKHTGEPDIAKSFLTTHPYVLWALVFASYADIGLRISRECLPKAPRAMSTLFAIAITSAAFSFKVSFTNADAPELLKGVQALLITPLKGLSLIDQATVVQVGIIFAVLYTMFRPVFPGYGIIKNRQVSATALRDLLSLFLMTQTRVTNIPMFLLFQCSISALQKMDLSGMEVTVTVVLMQFSTFFAFGGSNAISSIDLSSAYNGVRGYNIMAVGILTFLSNWAGPVWWASAATSLLVRSRSAKEQSVLRGHLALLSALTSGSILFVMLACTVLRTHLFVWTVFSPKYLYCMAWSIGQHLAINVVFGSLLYHLESPA